MTPVTVPQSRDIGQPIKPTGNPLASGLGPAAWADRADVPDLTFQGEPKIVPMRVAPDFYVEPRDPDPRGMTVLGNDGAVAGTVAEIWVDRSEPQVRYLEVLVTSTGKLVLLPITFCRVDPERRIIKVAAISAAHFADVPGTRDYNKVTLLEEDKIQAYYAGGTLYGAPGREDSLII
jgi:photosynthetic reaction center H subunit